MLKSVKKMTDWENERTRKIEEKRLQQTDPMEEECSFRPAVNKKTGEKRRTQEQFLAD